MGNEYIKQRLHAFTNATCVSLICYFKAQYILYIKGQLIDGFWCEQCADKKLKGFKKLHLQLESSGNA